MVTEDEGKQTILMELARDDLRPKRWKEIREATSQRIRSEMTLSKYLRRMIEAGEISRKEVEKKVYYEIEEKKEIWRSAIRIHEDNLEFLRLVRDPTLAIRDQFDARSIESRVAGSYAILEMYLLESLMSSIQEKVPLMAFAKTKSMFLDLLLQQFKIILNLYDLYPDETIAGLWKVLEAKDFLLENMRFERGPIQPGPREKTPWERRIEERFGKPIEKILRELYPNNSISNIQKMLKCSFTTLYNELKKWNVTN